MFVRVWRYRVPADHAAAFEVAYGSSGDWAQLFSLGVGYLGTELARDRDDPDRWLTVDRWTTRASWESFLDEHAEAYASLDARLSALTTDEVEIVAGGSESA